VSRSSRKSVSLPCKAATSGRAPGAPARPLVAALHGKQTLKELQDLMRLSASVIMRPLDRNMTTQKTWKDGQPTADLASTFIKPNDRLTSLERIEIYNRQYWFRLIDCLYEDYPGLLAVIGQSKFDRLLHAYIETYPSRSFSLRNLGDRLEQFITERPDLVKPRFELARQMAAFEWAQVVAFDDPEYPPVSVDDLLGKDPAKLRLSLQPYVRLLELDWPLDDYALALKRQQTALRSEASNAVDAPPAASTIRRRSLPKREKVFVAVHRHKFDLYFKRLDELGYRLLTALRDGQTLAAACVSAMEQTDPSEDPTKAIQALFKNWTELGWFYKRK
jgi:hypothetical protein